MPRPWYESLPRPAYSRLKRIQMRTDWFEVYEIEPDCYVFYEPRHCEEAVSSLVTGDQRAALIDTGCGIGDLDRAVRQVTDKPVVVINTHTHTDHIGGNPQFDNIQMFDHPVSRRVALQGVSHEIMQEEILHEDLVNGPWPEHFNPKGYFLSPFKVSRWLKEGDRIDLGNRDLEVIHTPGEAVDHISLLDRKGRFLFCGDLVVSGAVWTHLEGGSLAQLRESYIKLLDRADAFDRLMPSHNEPCLDKEYLTESLAGTDAILSGRADCRTITDPWGKRLKQYDFSRFSILTN